MGEINMVWDKYEEISSIRNIYDVYVSLCVYACIMYMLCICLHAYAGISIHLPTPTTIGKKYRTAKQQQVHLDFYSDMSSVEGTQAPWRNDCVHDRAEEKQNGLEQPVPKSMKAFKE